MSEHSKIDWTDATWNPTRGCSKVSPGCDHCYAIREAIRHSGPGRPYEGLVKRNPNNWTGEVHVIEHKLLEPLSWKRPRMIFVDSMSDLFHDAIPFEVIDTVFAVMWNAQWHTFQVLTKRAERMAAYFADPQRQTLIAWAAWKLLKATKPEQAGLVDPADIYADMTWPLGNVWLGVSAENQKYYDERLPHLLQCPAAVRFVSLEPLLGDIDLFKPCQPTDADWDEFHERTMDHEGWEEPEDFIEECEEECDWINFGPRLVHSSEHREWEADRQRYAQWLAFARQIQWVIAGGESGANARPMDPKWIARLRDQCELAAVPFFFKQWGEHAPAGADGTMTRVGKATAGHLLDGKAHREFPLGKRPTEITEAV